MAKEYVESIIEMPYEKIQIEDQNKLIQEKTRMKLTFIWNSMIHFISFKYQKISIVFVIANS